MLCTNKQHPHTSYSTLLSLTGSGNPCLRAFQGDKYGHPVARALHCGPSPFPLRPRSRAPKGSGRVWAGRRQHETAAKWRTTESVQSYAIYCRLRLLRLPPALTAAQRLPPALGIRSSVVPCCPSRGVRLE